MNRELKRHISPSIGRYVAMVKEHEEELDLLRQGVKLNESPDARVIYAIRLFRYITRATYLLEEETYTFKAAILLQPELDHTFVMHWGDDGPQGEPLPPVFVDYVATVLRDYAYTRGADFTVDKSSKGWAGLRSSAAVVNRSAFAACASDRAISDDEIKVVRATHEWFRSTMRDMLRACDTAAHRLLEVFEGYAGD